MAGLNLTSQTRFQTMKKESKTETGMTRGGGADLMGPINLLTILIRSTHGKKNLRSFSQNVTICYYRKNETECGYRKMSQNVTIGLNRI